MANHQSALKRIRQNESRRLHNRYFAKTMRNSVRKFRDLSDKKEAEELLPKLYAMIDKMAKKNLIHKNKAGNLKSSITKYANSLS
ncbi:MAG: 30S ribosomal protein S20 [Marinilabiliales bacterium]|nr:30S ribosomal protein S20 [Bacteroidota bacterium]PLW97222.1 MAG: 30S ribosomal protein S20 [Marinilabiliales bacterium]